MLNVYDAHLQRLQQQRLIWLKRLIWIYFWLLIFEGVLRKWVVPSLNGPLLIVRDPVALIIYAQAYRCRKFSTKTMWPFMLLAIVIILLACAQVIADINTIPIALYGLRSYLLHVPLVFVIADTLTGEDIRKFGRWLLILSVPMTILVLAQFNAPANSWLNAGAGEGATQLASTGWHIRPAGTFSYTAGMQCFIILVAAFIVDGFTRPGIYPRWLLYPALLATVAAVPLSGSRTVLFTMVGLAIFVFASGISHAARLGNLIKIVAILLLAGLIAIQLPFFNASLAAFSQRFTEASQSEGDVQEVLSKRVVGIFEDGIESAADTPWLGEGIGMGSNFAAVIKTGSTAFLLAETEWARVILEFGPIFGFFFMGARVAFAVYIVLQARRALARHMALAWLLVPAVAPLLIMTVMEQPTYLGFLILDIGICLAAARVAETPRPYPAHT